MPDVRRARFESEFGLPRQDAESLTASREMADYFETANAIAGDPKLTSNWIMGELSAAMNREGRDILTTPVTAELLGGMVGRIADNTISGKIAKDVFEAMWNGEGDADAIIEALGLRPHPEGGHYVETWRAEAAFDARPAGTAIYYLLQRGERSHWPRVHAAEIWHYYAGDPLALATAPPSGAGGRN